MAITFYEAVGGPVPKFEVEINLTSAGSTPSTTAARNLYIMAERVAAGTSTANAVSTTAFASADDAIAWFGANSPGAVMAAMIFNHRNPVVGKRKGGIYGVALAESAGVAATNTLTFLNAATGSGYWTFSVGGHQFSVGVATGDSAIVQATATVAAYEALPAHQRMACTVANGGTAVVTFTASVKGAHMNTIGFSTIHDPDVATTDTWAAATFTGGTLYPDTATALTNMAATKAPFIVVPWDADGWATEAEDVVDHINLYSDGAHMLGCTLIMADIDSASNLVSDADTLDDDDGERVMFVGAKSGEYWSGELAAKAAAIQCAEPAIPRSLNGLALQDIAVPTTAATNWTADELVTLLEGGVTPLWVPPGDDQFRIVRAVSIRTEYGVLDFALMPTLDYVRDDLATNGAIAFARCSIVGDDAELPDVEYVVQPKIISAWAKARCKEHERNGYLMNVDDNWENVEIEWDEANTVTMAIPVNMVPQLHNTMVRLDQEV
jgi:phage tail sheath gpL-like